MISKRKSSLNDLQKKKQPKWFPKEKADKPQIVLHSESFLRSTSPASNLACSLKSDSGKARAALLYAHWIWDTCGVKNIKETEG